MQDVVATLSRETGLSFTYEPMDPARALDILGKTGMEPSYAKSLAGAIVATAEGRYMPQTSANDTIARVTGRPAVQWADFAAKHRETFLKAGLPAR